jgi:peptidoglycan/LPS O-acetylase OafA/YrhL
MLLALSVGLLSAPVTERIQLFSSPYRSDIDGLRAISVISVLAYHAFPDIWPGGFVGVDIFFVISGYLITRIIVDRLNVGAFSLGDFYRRRVIRIFPALSLVLIATYAMGWYLLLPSDFQRLSTNILAGVGFVSNLMQMRQTDYFAPEASSNPLLHLWSLGIEEQFYISWPLMLFGLAKIRHRPIIFACMAAASFFLCVALVSEHQTAVFYAPVTRSWELLAGALLSELHRRRRGLVANSPNDGLKASFGIALIAIAMVMLSKTSTYPSWSALLPVLGAALIIDTPNSFLNSRILSQRNVVFIGLISFPLYLWHWPILTFLNIANDGRLASSSVLAAIALTFGLSWATYKLVEQPIKRQRHAVRTLIGAAALVSLTCIATIAGGGFDFRLPPEIRSIASAQFDPASRRKSCFRYPRPGAEKFGDDCVESGAGPLLFLWGDSTAATYYAGLKDAQKRIPFRIAQFTAPGCRPLIGKPTSDHSRCAQVNASVLSHIRDTSPDLVMLKGVWWPDDLAYLDNTIAALRKLHVPRILIVGPDPWFGRIPPPEFAIRYYNVHRTLPPERLKDVYIKSPNDSVMKKFAADLDVEYVSPADVFCDNDGCIFRTDGPDSSLVAFDTQHLTAAGSRFFIGRIEDRLFPKPAEASVATRHAEIP